jgi:transposase
MPKRETRSPAQVIIAAFGSNSEVSRILSVSKSTITRWGYDKENKGTNGRVPQKYWPTLIATARKRKIKLSVRDLAGL